MAQASAPTQGLDFHLLNSALLNFGVTPGGAFQFMQGLPVANQEDRDALRAMFQEMAKHASPKLFQNCCTGAHFKKAF
jgi:hypothetical protein